MAGSVKTARRYDSSLRTDQARATRQAIIAAASDLFGEAGYAATTVTAIARRAGVSVPTVYAAFGTKAKVLAALRDALLAGDDNAIAVAERRAWQGMLADTDHESRAARLATLARQINERAAQLNRLMQHSVGADPEMADLLEQEAADRRTDLAAVAATFVGAGRKRALLLDALWALVGPDLYALLVIDRQWSPRQYERWLAGQLWSAIGQCDPAFTA